MAAREKKTAQAAESAPVLPDFDTVEQHIYGACRRYITRDMLEPIHNLIRDAIDADRAARAPADSVLEDAERWRWLSEHIQVAWNEGKFTSLVRIVSEQHRQSLNASVDRMMAGDWSDAARKTREPFRPNTTMTAAPRAVD